MNIDSEIMTIIEMIKPGILVLGIDAGTHKQGVVCLWRNSAGALRKSNLSFITHPYSTTPFPVPPRSEHELLLIDRITDPEISKVLAFIELPERRHRKDPSRPAMEKKWRLWLSTYPQVRIIEVRIQQTYQYFSSEVRDQLADYFSLRTKCYLRDDTNDALATLLTGLYLDSQLR